MSALKRFLELLNSDMFIEEDLLDYEIGQCEIEMEEKQWKSSVSN